MKNRLRKGSKRGNMESKNLKPASFSGHRVFLLLLWCVVLGISAGCGGRQDSWLPESRPESRPNALITARQIQMIRIGDSEVRATALLGQPTTKKVTQNGSELVWYLVPVDFQEDAYETFKRPPKDPSEHKKFIRLILDPSGKITEREFEL